LSTILPKLEPLITAVSGAIDTVLGRIEKSVQNGSLDNMLSFFTKLTGPSILSFATFLGNVAQGFGGIASAFLPLSSSVLGALDKWSAGFAQIGSSQGLANFVSYVRREGPLVAQTLGSVGRGIGHILDALAPLGHVALQVLGGFSNIIGAIPTPILTAAAAAFVSIALSLKAINLAKPALKGLGGLFGGGGSSGSAGGGILGRGATPADPLYVLVTNKGFGGPGGPSLVSDAEATIVSIITKLKGPIGLLLATSGDSGPQAPNKQVQHLDAADNYLASIGFGPQNDAKLAQLVATGNQRSVDILQKTAQLAGLSVDKEVQFLSGVYKKTADAYTALKDSQSLFQLLVTPSVGKPTPLNTGSITNLFPHRASGGPVSQMQPYLVGESGPEFFLPAVNGTILNHQQSVAASRGGHTGPLFEIKQVVAQDVNSFLIDAQRRAVLTAGDGILR
jgi:hypothetical protein